MSNVGATRYPWYETVSGVELEQGDILLDCPVYLVPAEALGLEEHEVTVDFQNVIIMSQSCDLALRTNGTCEADDVILATLYFQSELKTNKTFGKKEKWEDARKGRFTRYHVLNKCEIEGHELDYMLVDLGRVFTLSVAAVRAFASADRKQRVRLLPPYREHLSQAYARLFMRVGLPVDIPKFA